MATLVSTPTSGASWISARICETLRTMKYGLRVFYELRLQRARERERARETANWRVRSSGSKKLMVRMARTRQSSAA